MSRSTDDLLELHADHRRQTARRVRHRARVELHTALGDDDALEDVDAVCPREPHDVGRRASPRAPLEPKPGRRRGFKVWKTPFWKRRRRLWAEQNEVSRRLGDND